MKDLITFTDREKKIMNHVGSSSRGDQFVEILQRLRRELSSIDGITGGGDYGAQVEGRKLFKEMTDLLITHLTHKEARMPIAEDDDYV